MNTVTRDSLSVTPKKFDRFGDSHYLRIDSGEALRQVLALPEAQWFASNAPLDGFRADGQFLQYLNENRDGRLRPQEIKSAIRWLLGILGPLGDEAVGSRVLRFASIKKDSEGGRSVLRAAEKVLVFLGKEDQSQVDLNDVTRVRKMAENDGLGRAGWVDCRVECSEPCRRLIQEVVETVARTKGSLCEDDLDQFLGQCRLLDEWEYERESARAEECLPFGDETSELFSLYRGLYDRIEAFYSLCQLARISPRIKALVNAESGERDRESRLPNLGDLEEVNALASTVPMASINSDGVLKFNGPLNPADRERLQQFRQRIVIPVCGDGTQSLKRDQWERIKVRFAVYSEWVLRRPVVQIDSVDADARRRYVRTSSSAVSELQRLFAESRENVIQLENVRLLEKTILYQAHLLAFANNFVSCPDLYSPAGRALFEMGTMILDGREFTFCVRVPDRDRHIRRCQGEYMFIIYAAISDVEGNVEYEIAAPVTSGFRGHLREGQWGVFHDSSGKEHNAQITQLLESPISLGEGLMAPFRRLTRAAIHRLDLISLEAEQGMRRCLSDEVPARGQPAGDDRGRRFSPGFLASGGLAAAALGTAGAYMAQTLAQTDLPRLFWSAVLIVSLLILPWVLTTALRLRNRDLRCLLEGASWGINLRMRLTPTLARTFTRQRRI